MSTSDAGTVRRGAAWRTASSPWVTRFAAIVFCGVLPVVTVVVLFATAAQDDAVAVDLRPHYQAAQAVLDGESPYPSPEELRAEELRAYVYPPLLPLVTVPFTALPFEAAGLLFMAILVAAAIGTLLILGVRDWRCYGVLFLWPPVLSAVQTGNVSLLFALCAALVWRFRDRTLPVSASLGVTLATKFFLWPLVVWLAATKRIGTALLACVSAAAVLSTSWAVIGFAGLVDYPELMRRLDDTVGGDSYTLNVVALDLGAPEAVARAMWAALGVGLLVAVVLLGRRGDERSAFMVAIAAALALSPIVWLHYFALLLVVVALARPVLGFLWFVPLAMIVTPGSGEPTPFETAWTLGIAVLTVALALRAASGVRPLDVSRVAESAALGARKSA